MYRIFSKLQQIMYTIGSVMITYMSRSLEIAIISLYFGNAFKNKNTNKSKR